MTRNRLIIAAATALLILALLVRWAGLHVRLEATLAPASTVEALTPLQWLAGSALSVGAFAVVILVTGGALLAVWWAALWLLARFRQ